MKNIKVDVTEKFWEGFNRIHVAPIGASGVLV